MARRQGGTLGGFTPLSTPNAPTGLSVSTSIGSASVSFTAPTDTGDGAVTSFIVTAIDESTGVSTGATGSASPITVSPGGGTFKIRAQAVNGFGPGRLTEFSTGNAIFSGAELYGWGTNSTRQIGDGTNTNRSSPVQVGALIDWSNIAAGADHSLAVKTNGTLWAWGSGGSGKLGIGSVTLRSSPVQVGALTNWSQIAAGNDVSAAITTGGQLYAWGNNGSGPLGDGTTISKSSPVQVGALTNWERVGVSDASCVAVKTDGTLWCWGSNLRGQLGQNNTINSSSPVQVGLLSDWAYPAAGYRSVICVKSNGTIWAFGENSGAQEGQLGDGTIIRRSSPVQIGALTNWAQPTAGGSFSAAVKTNGTLFAWGKNGAGQLGDGTRIDRNSPVQVGLLTNWASVAQGGGFTVAVKTDGTLWAWGAGYTGQLGINYSSFAGYRSSPVQVGALTSWFQVSSGSPSGAFSLALKGVP